MLEKYEFFNGTDGSVYVKTPDKPLFVYDSQCKDITDELFPLIRDLYPGAFKALAELYSKSERNNAFFMFRIVHRFIRCNLGENDTLSMDINRAGTINMEEVRCPLRGECIYEGTICKPVLQSHLTDRETEVGKLMGEGLSAQEVADELGISICTVHRHIANIKARCHFKSSAQIIAYFNARSNQI